MGTLFLFHPGLMILKGVNLVFVVNNSWQQAAGGVIVSSLVFASIIVVAMTSMCVIWIIHVRLFNLYVANVMKDDSNI